MIQPNEARLLFLEIVNGLKPEVFKELAEEPFQVFKRMSAVEWDTARVSIVSHRFECRKDLAAFRIEQELEKALVDFALQQPMGFALSRVQERFESKGVDPREAIKRLVDKGVFETVELNPHSLNWRTPTLRRLHDLIVRWMSRWNLEAPWCFEFAFQTLSQWRRNPGDGKDLRLDTHFEDSTPLTELSFRVEFNDPFSDFWWPSEETKAAARKRLTRKAKAQVEDYLTKVETRAADWLPRNDATRRDLILFVAYQVMEQSESKLAEVSGVTQPRVSQIVRRIGAVIGLPPRPPKPAGRPETPWEESLLDAISK